MENYDFRKKLIRMIEKGALDMESFVDALFDRFESEEDLRAWVWWNCADGSDEIFEQTFGEPYKQ